MASKTAGSLADEEAVRKAGPIILEPIMLVEVTTSGDYFVETPSATSTDAGVPLLVWKAVGRFVWYGVMLPLCRNVAATSTTCPFYMTSGRASYYGVCALQIHKNLQQNSLESQPW